MRRNDGFPDIETAERLLEEACEALPEAVFQGLNGGVNLQPGWKRSPDGLYTLGLYHNDAMGRWIELFYGSMRAVQPDCDEAALGELLSSTLRHELTHHLESMAGDRSLELWDETHRAELLSGFYDEDCGTAQFAGGRYTSPASALHRRRRQPDADPEC